MPKIENIEETPNPNAVKFILREPVTAGTTRSFHSAGEAEGDPVAGPLFAVGEVSSVFYMDKMITVEKTDEADWDDLLPRLAVPIRAVAGVGAGVGAQTQQAAAASAGVGGPLGAMMSDDPRLARINEMLDEKIRPYLASDGGWLEVVSLKEHTLTIHYQGACGSCPSSLTGTLMGIEGLIRQEIDPDIEVVAI
ncbi:MAG TPA: NifU family protein [Pyrinomonadaceae bacterium]|nr:NifU family protein [Pyrinomonadaceae bacterium]